MIERWRIAIFLEGPEIYLGANLRKRDLEIKRVGGDKRTVLRQSQTSKTSA